MYLPSDPAILLGICPSDTFTYMTLCLHQAVHCSTASGSKTHKNPHCLTGDGVNKFGSFLHWSSTWPQDETWGGAAGAGMG